MRGAAGLGAAVAPVVDEQGLVVGEQGNDPPCGLLPVLEGAKDAV